MWIDCFAYLLLPIIFVSTAATYLMLTRRVCRKYCYVSLLSLDFLILLNTSKEGQSKLSKVYNCLTYVCLIAYGFDKTALSLIIDYLKSPIQCVKIGSTFSSYLEILSGIIEDHY